MLRNTLVLCLAFSGAACGGQSTSNAPRHDGGTDATRDAPVAMDAPAQSDAPAQPDAAPEAMPPLDAAAGTTPVGAPCQHAAQCVTCASAACASPTCLTQGFTNGYCSVQITECPAPSGGHVCPAGSTCTNALAGGDYCASVCTSDADCRQNEGYKCCPSLTLSGDSVCVPSGMCP